MDRSQMDRLSFITPIIEFDQGFPEVIEPLMNPLEIIRAGMRSGVQSLQHRMQCEAHRFSGFSITRKVHHFEPYIDIALVEPPAGDRDIRPCWSGDGKIDHALAPTTLHDTEDCRPDERFKLQLSALSALDRGNFVPIALSEALGIALCRQRSGAEARAGFHFTHL
jgi:hypothetical protein